MAPKMGGRVSETGGVKRVGFENGETCLTLSDTGPKSGAERPMGP